MSHFTPGQKKFLLALAVALVLVITVGNGHHSTTTDPLRQSCEQSAKHIRGGAPDGYIASCMKGIRDLNNAVNVQGD